MKKEGIFGSIKGFFEESEEELKEDIKEAEELIKEKKAKLKEAKTKKGFFSKLFDESEEEIKEEIKEAEELIKEKKKQLESVKDKGVKSENKEKEEKQDKKGGFSWIIIGLIIIGILFIVIGFIQSATLPEKFEYKCEPEDKNPCQDCPYVAHCFHLEEIDENSGFLHFEVENKQDLDKECKVKVQVVKGDEVLESKTYSLGVIESMKSVKTKVGVSVFDGDSEYTVDPFCE